jgi:hypothetical protein
MGNPTTNSVVYYPGGDESPTLTIGALGNDTSYVFAVATNDLQEGMVLTMLDISNLASFGFTYTNSTKDDTFDMGIGRVNESGEQIFGHEGVEIAPDCVAVLQYGNWTGNSQPMPMNLVCGDDSETVELKDMSDELPK